MKLFRFVLFAFLASLCLSGMANITSQTNRVGPYTISSLPATLSVTFPFQSSSELLVLNLGQLGTENDPAEVLTLNSDYTVTGGGYNSTTNMQSGNVVVVSSGAHSVAVGDYIVILRNVPVNQPTSLTSGVLTAAAVERALDRQATLSQQLTETTSRALRFEKGETIDGTLLRSARAGKYLAFDSDGNIEYLDGGGGGGGGTTYTAGAGLLLASNEFSVNPAQSLTSLTVTDPIVGTITGGAASAAVLDPGREINGVLFDGSANITVAAAADTLTGTTLAGTVVNSSLQTAAVGTLASMATQDPASVNITGGTIDGATVTGLPAPSASTDAATKDYVDNISAGITPRTGVVAATTANITLSGEQTIDGQAVVAGNRVLVKNQTLPEENGIYDCAAGAWSRSSDSNTAAELLFGYYYFVSSGTTNGATSWFIQTAPTVLGTDPVVFSQFSASQNYTAGSGLSLVGSQFALTSPVTAALGGTGQAGGYSAGDILYATGATSLAKLGIGAAGTVLTPNGSAIQWNANPTLTSLQAGNIGNVTPGTGVFTTLSTSGKASLGGTTANPARVVIGGTATGGTTAYGAYQNTVVASDVTSAFVGFRSVPSTTASVFTLAQLQHFSVGTGTIGAGSVITNQIGYGVDAAMVGATNNYGFYGNIPAASGRWNLYMAGTAANYLAGELLIGSSTDLGSYELQVTGTPIFTGNTTIGTGSAATTRTLVLNGGTNANTGSYVDFQRGGTSASRVGVDGPITGSSTNDLGLWANTGNSISFYVDGSFTRLARMTTTGLNVAGAYSVSTDANIRTTKGNFNVTVNVEDYGATGDGSTNDTAAIAAAVAALPATNATLVFPAGTYITDTITITGKTGLSVVGEGIGVSIIESRTGSQVLNISSSTYVTVSGLTFDGSCVARTAGQQAVIIDASKVQFIGNEILNSGEYALFFGSGATPAQDIVVANNIIRDSYADGINMQNVQRFTITGNVVDGVDDDCIAIGYNGSGIAQYGSVTGNFCRARTDLGTTWGRGIAIIGASDIVISGNYVTNIKQYGLYLAKEAGARVTRVKAIGNTIHASCVNSGSSIAAYGTTDCTLEGNDVMDPVSGNLIDIADWANLTIKGGTLTQNNDVFARGIHCDEGTGWSSTTWTNLVIKGVTIRLYGASTNSGIYLVPNAANTLSVGLIDNNDVQQVVDDDYITLTSSAGTRWKIVNNTDMTGGRTINQTTGGVFTVTNNN